MAVKPLSLEKIDLSKLREGHWIQVNIENWGRCIECQDKSKMPEMFYCIICATTIHPLCLDAETDLYDDPRFQLWKCSTCEQKEKNNKHDNGEGSSKDNIEEPN